MRGKKDVTTFPYIYIYIYNRENYQAVHNWCVCQISDDTALNLS